MCVLRTSICGLSYHERKCNYISIRMSVSKMRKSIRPPPPTTTPCRPLHFYLRRTFWGDVGLTPRIIAPNSLNSKSSCWSRYRRSIYQLSTPELIPLRLFLRSVSQRVPKRSHHRSCFFCQLWFVACCVILRVALCSAAN